MFAGPGRRHRRQRPDRERAGRVGMARGWRLAGVRRARARSLIAAVWRILRAEPCGRAAVRRRRASMAVRRRHAPSAATVAPPARPAEVLTLAVAYGLAGFGYIVTATFLPVIARAALPASPWLDLFWPIFGAGVIVGALLATRVRSAAICAWCSPPPTCPGDRHRVGIGLRRRRRASRWAASCSACRSRRSPTSRCRRSPPAAGAVASTTGL